MKLFEMTWPEFEQVDRRHSLIVAPQASCEQHSRHLPAFTDTILVTAVAEGVERARPDRVVLLPTQWLGASEHHLPFGATLTAGLETYLRMVCESVEPLLEDGFMRLILLNGHGGNSDPLRVAIRQLHCDFPDALVTAAAYWELAAPELAQHATGRRKVMGHAGEFETSMIMHLRPDLVRTAEIRDDPEQDPAGLPGLSIARDMAQRTNHGAVGYPECASAEKGRAMLDAVIQRVIAVVDQLLDWPLDDTEVGSSGCGHG